jgi:hypothetical protein
MTNTVPRLWPGSTVVCIASGPSLTREDVDYARGKARVIAINANYKVAPWADVWYAADARFWRWVYSGKRPPYEDGPAFLREYAGMKYCLTSGAADLKGIIVLRRGVESGLSLNPAILNTGHNSGYQALNLAVLLGASRILLLGYDMQRGPKGEEHHHADHPNKSRSNYDRFRKPFSSLVTPLADAGVEVINCTRRTALTCFPQMPITEALPASAEVAA